MGIEFGVVLFMGSFTCYFSYLFYKQMLLDSSFKAARRFMISLFAVLTFIICGFWSLYTREVAKQTVEPKLEEVYAIDLAKLETEELSFTQVDEKYKDEEGYKEFLIKKEERIESFNTNLKTTPEYTNYLAKLEEGKVYQNILAYVLGTYNLVVATVIYLVDYLTLHKQKVVKTNKEKDKK